MKARLGLVLLAAVVLLVAVPAALAALTVTRAELSGDQLRVEGQGAVPNSTITIDGVAMGTAASDGRFRIERSGFSSPTCTIAVGDGATTTQATLSGCTPPSSPPAPPPPAASGASLSALTVDPTDVVAGDTATGTVTLTSAAPAGGFEVALSSDNTAAASVPTSVTVPAGATSARFTVSTNTVSNSQSAIIAGTAGGITRHSVITVWTPFQYANGSISIVPGGNGSGVVTSQPTGINCTITRGNGAGTCSAFFTVGTVVRLDARPASDSKFVGWRSLPGCFDASKVTVARGTNITCQPGFSLR